MPKNVTENAQGNYDFSMKHRLVGAAILISFAVLILPWILGSSSNGDDEKIVSTEQAPQQSGSQDSSKDNKVDSATTQSEPNIDIVEADENIKVFVSRVQPVDDVEAVAEQKKDAEPVKQETKPKQVKQSAKEVKANKAVKTKKVTEKSVAKVKRGYIVSVGVFGDSKNANNLVTKLKGKGFSPVTRKENFKSKQVTRIYFGPFASRSEAGKMKLRLLEQQKMPSLVKEFP